MHFYFEIKKVPSRTDSYYLPAYVEGEINLLFEDGSSLFRASDFLLVELAIALKKWLRCPQKTDFHYSSMDFEEEDILSYVMIDGTSLVYVDSTFNASRVANINERQVRFSEAVKASETYIEDLKEELVTKYQIVLSDELLTSE